MRGILLFIVVVAALMDTVHCASVLDTLPIPGSDGYGKGDGYTVHGGWIYSPYRRGNSDHNREEEQDNTFKTKLKWHDAFDGHGEHYFDYNHGSAYKEPAPYAPAPPSYSPPVPAYAYFAKFFKFL